MFLEFCSLVFLAAISLVLFWYYKLYCFEKVWKNVPGPTPIPVLGNAFDFSSTHKVLDTLCAYKEKYGTIVKIQIGSEVSILVSDYQMLEHLLSTTKILTKSRHYHHLHNWLGQGLLTSSGEKWRQRRKIITPTFHFKILEQFVDIFDSASDILIEQLHAEVGKDSIDIYRYVTLCALDIICETAMGTSVNAQHNQESDYVQSVKEMCRIIIARGFSAIEQNNFLYRFTKNYQIERRSLQILHTYTNSVIKRRRRELEEQKMNSENEDDDGVKRKVAFLDSLLQCEIDGKALTDEEIREEVDTFMFEGHDTTSSAISYCLYNISRYPEIQRRIVDEQRQVFGDNQQIMAGYNDLQEMKYLEMVIKETLRLFPSIPYYARRTNSNVDLNGYVTIPKDTNLTIFVFGIHRDAQYYPDPEVFDPERFNPENVGKKAIYSYLPFSAGPRNCIGQKYAMLEMKAVISKVVRQYELKRAVPDHELQLISETILKSANGILLKLDNRKW